MGRSDTTHPAHLLQEVLQEPVELVHLLVEELGASDVYPVEDGELLVAQGVIGLGADLQDLRVRVLLHDLPDLTQQSLQVLCGGGRGCV